MINTDDIIIKQTYVNVNSDSQEIHKNWSYTNIRFTDFIMYAKYRHRDVY